GVDIKRAKSRAVRHVGAQNNLCARSPGSRRTYLLLLEVTIRASKMSRRRPQSASYTSSGAQRYCVPLPCLCVATFTNCWETIPGGSDGCDATFLASDANLLL